MRAIVQSGYGAPEQVLKLKEVERPVVTDRSVLIRVRATSVNTPDWINVTGEPTILRPRAGLRKPRSPVRGTDVAGVVEEVGRAVTGLQPGDEVFGSLWDTKKALHPPGTFAEFTVALPEQLLAKPAGLTYEETGALAMSGLTALAAIRDAGQVAPGKHVLINGASGGVGLLAAQIAKALGAEVTGVCSGGSEDLVRSVGVDRVIDYEQEDFTRGDTRYDVILDNVMNHPPTETIRVLKPGGTFIPNSVGNTGGLLAGLPRMARSRMLRSVDVRFVSCIVNRENLAELARLIEAGDIRLVVDSICPLEDTPRAVARMLSHRARGKIVITV